MARKPRNRIDASTRSIPRRLRELGYSSYQEYLSSPHWLDLRQRFRDSKHSSVTVDGKPCCKACLRHDRWLAVHHLTYRRLGRESLHDLMLVCDPCHQLIHSRRKGSLRTRSKRVVREKRAELLVRRDMHSDDPSVPW